MKKHTIILLIVSVIFATPVCAKVIMYDKPMSEAVFSARWVYSDWKDFTEDQKFNYTFGYVCASLDSVIVQAMFKLKEMKEPLPNPIEYQRNMLDTFFGNTIFRKLIDHIDSTYQNPMNRGMRVDQIISEFLRQLFTRK